MDALNHFLDQLRVDGREVYEWLHDYNVNEAQWWGAPLNDGYRYRSVSQFFGLIHSELSEAVEGFRKTLMDDHLPAYKNAPVELVDGIMRCMDFLGACKLYLGDEFDQRIREMHDLSYVKSSYDFMDLIQVTHTELDRPFIAHPYYIGTTVRGGTKVESAVCPEMNIDQTLDKFHDLGTMMEPENDIRERYDDLSAAVATAADQMINTIIVNFGVAPWELLLEKHEYNKTRADHQLSERATTHGKKF